MRLFVGTMLSESNRHFYDGLATGLVAGGVSRLRPIPRSSAHLTYLFSAHVDPEDLDALWRASRRVSARVRPFAIAIGRPHVLWARAEPRLVYAEILTGCAELDRLAATLTLEMRTACPSRDFQQTGSPHVTLARFGRAARRSDGDAVERRLTGISYASSSRSDRIGVVQIIESTLTKTQPEYTVLAETPLEAAGPEPPT